MYNTGKVFSRACISVMLSTNLTTGPLISKLSLLYFDVEESLCPDYTIRNEYKRLTTSLCDGCDARRAALRRGTNRKFSTMSCHR